MHIITDELEDYQLLRQLWLKGVNAIMDDETLKTSMELMTAVGIAAKIRATIDDMSRKAVELPSSYTKKVNVDAPVEEVRPNSIELTLSGPKYRITEGDNGDKEDYERSG